ncbi:hypothetical protein KOAAANKH_02566 [Brevundimonas sp. NIBR10]|uniref:hypothetical protein n=1 Tax=Brevundimonas sp. NIBR10 TaxID=3015997 RepID=UPI0022F1BC18|nr:hypothetical protein [Brevundimonas sp. NIBR10]WGM47684.1 hypothetical protein KOAAANKH_02566 [Brevundimonas sp. NIBR10]
MSDAYSFRTGAPVDLIALEIAAQRVSRLIGTATSGAHRIRTAIAWDARNDLKRDEHIVEARELLVDVIQTARLALAGLEAATNPEPPTVLSPEQIRRADLVATMMDIASTGVAA